MHLWIHRYFLFVRLQFRITVDNEKVILFLSSVIGFDFKGELRGGCKLFFARCIIFSVNVFSKN